jgi:hypothetical protein
MSASKTVSWRCTMPNPCIQVALTYFRQPFSSARRSLLILSILFFLVIFFFVAGRSENHHEFSPIHLFLFIVLFAYWAIHLKEQFADSRASLMPGFRTVHGVVAAMAAIVFGVLLPGVMAPLIGWQSLGFVSITTLLFGAILWFILHPGFFTALITVGCISILVEPIRSGIEQIVWGHKPVQAFIFMGVGAVLSITGIIRLFLLNEEMPEYNLNIRASREGRTQWSDLQWQRIEKSHSRGLRSKLTDRPIENLIYHAQHATDSNWSRIRRWSVSNITVWSAGLIAVVFYLMFMLIGFFTGSRIGMAMPFGMSTCLSIGTVIGSMGVKNRSISHELMMPVRRAAYLKQLGMSAAIDQIIMWGAFMAVFIVWMFTVAAKPDPELLAYMIAYSAWVQIWVFGLAVWLLSFRSNILTVMIISIAIIPTLVPLAALDAQLPLQWRPLILLFGGLLAGIGLMLTRSAYCRWMIADFD